MRPPVDLCDAAPEPRRDGVAGKEVSEKASEWEWRRGEGAKSELGGSSPSASRGYGILEGPGRAGGGVTLLRRAGAGWALVMGARRLPRAQSLARVGMEYVKKGACSAKDGVVVVQVVVVVKECEYRRLIFLIGDCSTPQNQHPALWRLRPPSSYTWTYGRRVRFRRFDSDDDYMLAHIFAS